MPSKRYAKTDKDLCVACGVCAAACPIGAVQIYLGMYALIDESKCVGCGKCQKLCPANSIDFESRVSV